MQKSFHVALESLTGTAVAEAVHAVELSRARNAAGGTFFLETFGCQMNDHDSEKVAGVLVSRGYTQVRNLRTPR